MPIDRESETKVIPIRRILDSSSSGKISHQRPKRGFDGPISGRMWEKVTELNSAYPDTFNWQIYDDIASRYEQQPRGGVVFKTTFKLINHHTSCTQCHYALELDTYGRGCIHDCTYCYAKELLLGRGFWNRPMPFPVDLAELRKQFHRAFETDEQSKWSDLLRRRVPIRIGCMSDSFMWMDYKYKVTLETLKMLRFYKYPYIIATRSDLAAHDDYIAAMDPELASVQFSLTGTNETYTRIVEPGAPSLKRRLVALKKLAEAGFWTTARLNPLFPTFPDGYFTDPQSVTTRFGSLANAPRFPLFEIDKLDEFIEDLVNHKVPTLMPGFVRLSTFAIRAISKSCNLDFGSFFKPEYCKKSDDRHYSDSEIAYYYKLIQDKCARRGIRFTTCYIGNGEKDYYQYQDLWTNKTDCCDALGNVPRFATTSQSIDWNTRFQFATNKTLATAALEQEKLHKVKYKHILEKYHTKDTSRPGLTTALKSTSRTSAPTQKGELK
ncbi:MAG: hypothetical protein A2603_11725 [Bdellovibrionales bacterium RIFOXYD1_FULL_55_31]|nr:MAG: hypothetical protein A2603_11725 [Bdellovibrionales bacterium RIFOXYD1_FULL_55_31]